MTTCLFVALLMIGAACLLPCLALGLGRALVATARVVREEDWV